jgi:hypothetical protein
MTDALYHDCPICQYIVLFSGAQVRGITSIALCLQASPASLETLAKIARALPSIARAPFTSARAAFQARVRVTRPDRSQ